MPFYPSEGFSGFDPTYISEGLTFEEGKAMARPWEMAVGGPRFCTQVFYKDKYVDLINSFCVAYENTYKLPINITLLTPDIKQMYYYFFLFIVKVF